MQSRVRRAAGLMVGASVTLLAACTGGHRAAAPIAAPTLPEASLSSSSPLRSAPPSGSPSHSPSHKATTPHRTSAKPAPSRTSSTSPYVAPSTSTYVPPPPRTSAAPPPPAYSGSASIAGCPLFPADNPWRQDISKLPLNRRSAAWVASAGLTTHLHPDFGSDPTYGIPYSVVPAGQPKVRITFTDYGDESDPGPYPIPPTARVEAGGDAHVLVASGDCHLYELYNASRNGSGWNASSGAVFDLRSNSLRPAGWTSADAAGLPILPGLVRRDEIQAGHIDHALRFTVSRTQRGYISPATHQAGSTTDVNVPPMGARFRLKASFDLSRYHGAARVVLVCLKKYGMFVADNGSNWYISGSTDTGWNDDDLNQLKTVPGSAFEVVDTGAVHTG